MLATNRRKEKKSAKHYHRLVTQKPKTRDRYKILDKDKSEKIEGDTSQVLDFSLLRLGNAIIADRKDLRCT